VVAATRMAVLYTTRDVTATGAAYASREVTGRLLNLDPRPVPWRSHELGILVMPELAENLVDIAPDLPASAGAQLDEKPRRADSRTASTTF